MEKTISTFVCKGWCIGFIFQLVGNVLRFVAGKNICYMEHAFRADQKKYTFCVNLQSWTLHFRL